MSENEFFAGDMGKVHVKILETDREGYINMTMGADGLAPLHLSQEFPNPKMLLRLLRAGAEIDVRSALGRTPLIHAINLCAEATAIERRKDLIEAAVTLVERGADVNASSHVIIGESPLVCAILADVDAWGRASHDLKALLMFLIDKGANINGNGTGPSIIHALCEKIRERGGNQSLEDLLDLLIQRGGNVNLPASPPGPSILLDFMNRYNDVPAGFFKKLVTKYGATIRPTEANAALYSWVRCPKLQSASRGYNVLRHHKHHMTARAFRYAWEQAFQKGDKVFYLRLVAECPPPDDAADLVATALKTPNHGLWAYVHTLTFDANYVSPEDGMSFLHMIVHKLGTTNGRESQAVKDANFFIERGMSVCITDQEGLTALQRLRRLSQPYAELRLLIHEARAKELGEL
ncbi:hypothetical protein HRG_003463 [Hirsutella rhossiliensis]|uniref:Ankyrin repeat protein n=1 Tax=Hirsutella rhossiliensis TaxID=111463 RepID=A0A9P8N1Z0_9HYPO|nr:uncharacterized protein HRG_03463 [Hirsutella rhossiliensis]KAH0965447.1 hypothetical protein HRG_03463 [Hirsutella rhossiliensis]